MGGAAGEQEIAGVVAEWLERSGLEVRLEETNAGRPNVLARKRGARSGRTLLLLAHTDTVGTAGMQAPFEGRVEGGRLHGRGAELSELNRQLEQAPRHLPGDGPGAALGEAVIRSGVEAELRLTHQGDPFEPSADAEIIEIMRRHAETEIAGLGFWADSE